MRPISFLHVESDPLWAEYVASSARHWCEFRSLEPVSTPEEALEQVAAERPAFILLDVGLANADPFALATDLMRAWPRARVLLFTGQLASYLLYRSLDRQIDGLLLKSLHCCAQLREAMMTPPGHKYFSPEARASLDRFRASPTAFHKLLSPREVDLLRFFAVDQSEMAISASLGLAEATIRWHKYQIMAKLGLHRNVDLLRWAHENGFTAFRRTQHAVSA